jgi:hypothetical protein
MKNLLYRLLARFRRPTLTYTAHNRLDRNPLLIFKGLPLEGPLGRFLAIDSKESDG